MREVGYALMAAFAIWIFPAAFIGYLLTGSSDPELWSPNVAWWAFTWPIWVPVTVLLLWQGLASIPGVPVRRTPYAILRARAAKSSQDRRTAAEAAAAAKAAAAERKAAEERAAATAASYPAWLIESRRTRTPRDADDFETVCAQWLRSQGLAVSRTPKGPDGGLDLVGGTYAGQCKFHTSQKIGAPDIQRLAGAAQQARKRDLGFFHHGPGYTDAAIKAARELGIKLWHQDPRTGTFRQVE